MNGIDVRLAVAPLLMIGACVTPFHVRAQHVFEATYRCNDKDTTVIHRHDISKPGTAPGTFVAEEIAGCGNDMVYMCQGLPSSDDPDFPGGDQCVPEPDWCKGIGCATDFARAARVAFSLASSCPLDRVRSAPHPASPPPDIAADPQRLAMWQRAQQTASAADIDVHGCGADVALHCEGHSPSAPACAPIGGNAGRGSVPGHASLP